MRDHGTRQRHRLCSRSVDARVNQGPTRYAEHTQTMTQTFNKFGPAVARPLWPVSAAPNPIMIPLDLAGLRRGLASYLFKMPEKFLYERDVC